MIAILIIIALVVIAGIAVSRGKGLLGGSLYEAFDEPIVNEVLNN